MVFLTQIPPQPPQQVWIWLSALNNTRPSYNYIGSGALSRIRLLLLWKLTPSGAVEKKEFSKIDVDSRSLAYPPVLSRNRLTLSVIYYEWLLMRQTAADAVVAASSATKLDSNAISISSPMSALGRSSAPKKPARSLYIFSQQSSTLKSGGNE